MATHVHLIASLRFTTWKLPNKLQNKTLSTSGLVGPESPHLYTYWRLPLNPKRTYGVYTT